MVATNESTKAKSLMDTSNTTKPALPSNPSQNTSTSAKRPTDAKDVTKFEKETESLMAVLARLLDLVRAWYLIFGMNATITPMYYGDYVIIAFPLKQHDVKNSITSDGKMNFTVDGMDVLD